MNHFKKLNKTDFGIKCCILMCGFLGLFSSIESFATGVKNNAVWVKNLGNIDYPGHAEVAANIQKLSEDANDDEYRLGMVVLAGALQNDRQLYDTSLERMQKAVSPLKKETEAKQNAYKAWRLGRILLAADSIGDDETMKRVKLQLKGILQNNNTAKNAFSAWGWAYLAAINKTEYDAAKEPMLAAAASVTDDYHRMQEKISSNSSKKAKAAFQGKLSDALWAWVLSLQAAANAKDKETYTEIQQKIREVNVESSVTAALQNDLKRVSDSNDYPAWALSIVRLAAATMDDKVLFDETTKPLADSTQGANTAIGSGDKDASFSARAETTLAQLDAALANARWQTGHKN